MKARCAARLCLVGEVGDKEDCHCQGDINNLHLLNFRINLDSCRVMVGALSVHHCPSKLKLLEAYTLLANVWGVELEIVSSRG